MGISSGTDVKEFGGTHYVFSKLPASKALRVHAAIARLIADLLKGGGDTGALMRAISKKEEDALTPEESKSQLDAIASVITGISVDDWVTPDGRKMMGLESLMTLMFEHVKVKAGNQQVDIDIDNQFSDRTGDMYKVLAHSLRHNFAGFLGESLSRSSRAEGQAA